MKYYVEFYDDGTLRSYAKGEYDFTKDGMEEVSEELYNNIPYLKKANGIINIDYVAKSNGEQEKILNDLRQKRQFLLTAFDKWEKAVLRGREVDDVLIMDWYNNLLKLNEIAFSNIPIRIQYYMN